jgi:hypothetical protein
MESTHRFPQSLEIASRFPHSTQAGDEADGKMENQRQVYHFPTARFSPSLKTQETRARLQPRPEDFIGKNSCPRTEKYLTRITRAQLSMLLEGIDWRQPARTWKPAMAV